MSKNLNVKVLKPTFIIINEAWIRNSHIAQNYQTLRTGVENPLAVTPSRLVYFFFSREASVRGLGCPSVLMFVSLLVKAMPLHPRLAVILLQLFQESVSRPCAQGCKRVKPPYRNSPGKVPWTVSSRPSYWIPLSRDDSLGEVPAPTWFVTPEGTHAICVKLPNWSTEG